MSAAAACNVLVMLRALLGSLAICVFASCSSSGGGGGTGGTGGSSGSGGGAGVGGNSGTGGGTATVDCASYCNLYATPACSADVPADCTTDCQNFPGNCAQQAAAVVSCAQAGVTVSCGPDDKAQIVGCFDQTDTLDDCRICAPRVADSDCKRCWRKSCCAEFTNQVTHPDALKWTGCITDCPDDACVDACKQQYPDYAAILAAFDTCEQVQCGAQCPVL
jgi:hypothetical protein